MAKPLIHLIGDVKDGEAFGACDPKRPLVPGKESYTTRAAIVTCPECEMLVPGARQKQIPQQQQQTSEPPPFLA